MKFEADKIFDVVVNNSFQLTLKQLGFKKKTKNFYRQLPELGQIINIQKSSLCSNDSIKFTINIGLFIPEFWLNHYSYHDGIIPLFPTEPECAIRLRLGELKYQEDKWFEVSSDTNIQALQQELSDGVLNFIIPYLDRAKSRDDIVTLLDDRTTNVETLFGRLELLGEYQKYDKAQQEYSLLRADEYIIRNHLPTLREYCMKYNLQDLV